MMEKDQQNYNSVQTYQWSGLKQMLTNLARFSIPVLPIPFITFIVLIFVGFSGGATGWCAALVFRQGMIPESQNWWIATISGYAFGLALAGFILIDVIYTTMSNIKLTGEDYDDKDKESKYKRFGISVFRLLGRTTTIVSCAMFTYAQVSMADQAEIKTLVTKESKMELFKKQVVLSDSIYFAQVKYYQGLDIDGDKTNDNWARKRLEEIEDNYNIELANRKKEYDSILNMPDKPETVLASANAIDGTRLLKDLGSKSRPENWTFKVLLILLSIVIGFCPEGVIARGGDMIGKNRAFKNVKHVLGEVEKLSKQSEEISESYDKKPGKFSELRKVFSLVNGGKNGAQNGGGGDGFDFKSEKIKEMVDYIKENWRLYGGDKTQVEIAEKYGCDKSYISQLVRAAANRKMLIHPEVIRGRN